MSALLLPPASQEFKDTLADLAREYALAEYNHWCAGCVATWPMIGDKDPGAEFEATLNALNALKEAENALLKHARSLWCSQ